MECLLAPEWQGIFERHAFSNIAPTLRSMKHDLALNSFSDHYGRIAFVVLSPKTVSGESSPC